MCLAFAEEIKFSFLIYEMRINNIEQVYVAERIAMYMKLDNRLEKYVYN